MAPPNSIEVARTARTSASRVDFVLSGLVVAVFFARFYLPTEATAQGETLWIVSLWLLIGIAASLVAWRRGFPARRLDWLDGSVMLLIGGQVVSAIVVVATTGDKRAAVNVAWEWFGIGVVWFLLRSRMVNASFREEFVRASIVTGTVLAGLGFWQHYVSQPQLAAQYGPLFDRLRTASGLEAEAIQRELAAAGIPTEGPGLTLFEKRLRDSREPMGLFGLANTFGGCLAVWLVVTLGEMLAVGRRDRTRWRFAVPFISLSLIALCLLLTKSRTALMGAGCGAAVLLAGSWLPSLHRRHLLLGLGLGVALVTAAVGALLQFGGLDREVLSEAPKSLAYRLQYWQATSRLMADHFWLGVGPGNFRQHYLKYKLPAASEEIADPHNLFFDVAATGGVVSLVGLVMLIGLTLVARRRDECLTVSFANGGPRAESSPPSRGKPARSEVWFAGLGPLLAFAGLLAMNGVWDDRLLVLAVVWYLVAWVWVWQPVPGHDATVERNHFRLAIAACVALTVHLLGAGGIAMPAASQLLLVLAALSVSPTNSLSETSPVAPALRGEGPGVRGSWIGSQWLLKFAARTPLLSGNQLETDGRGVHPTGFQQAAHGPDAKRPLKSPWTIAVLTGCLLVAATVFAGTALVPVTKGRWWQARGDELMSSRTKRSGAETAYRTACLVDDWAPEPWRRRAELAFEQASIDNFRSNESFEAAVKLLLAAIERDPHNAQGPRTLGNWRLARWRVTQSGDDARQAADWLRRASDSYPTNASILAELAAALDAAGQRGDATAIARRAMAQDQLNRKLGHVDRQLADELVTQLQGLAEETDSRR